MKPAVVITRDAAHLGEFQPRLQALGLQVVPVQCLMVEPLDADADASESKVLREALRELQRTAWLGLASAQAVRFLWGMLPPPGLLPKTCRVAVVGPATAKAVRRQFGVQAFLAQPHNAAGLGSVLLDLAQPKDGRVTIFGAQGGRREAYDQLVQRGYNVHLVALYRTTPASAQFGPPALPKHVTAVVFLSPSAVIGFWQRTGGQMPKGARLISIGPSTSAALQAHGLPVAAEAQPHNLEGLVQVLAQL